MDKKLGFGTNHCLCANCGEYFTSVRYFDMHRTGKAKNRKCVDPALVTSKEGKPLLRLTTKGLWASARRFDAESLKKVRNETK